MTLRMFDRLVRLERVRARGPEQPPPGMVAVLMYGIARRLGDYPQPQDLQCPHLSDGISEGLARGLGYGDWHEMDHASRIDANAWGARLNEAMTRLLRTEGIDREDADEADVFRALARILDEPPAAVEYRRHAGWADIGEQLDNWIRFTGLSPEMIRAEAQA